MCLYHSRSTSFGLPERARSHPVSARDVGPARAGAEQDSAAAPSRGAHSPVDAFGLLPSDGAAVPIRDEGDAFEGDVVEGAVEGAAALTFRDVVLRSGALEALVLSYVDAPSSGDVETSLLVELLRDALMFDVDEDAGTARASAYYCVTQATPELPLQVIVTGHYRDTFHRVDGAWWFDSRTMYVDQVGDTSRHLKF